MNNGRPSRAISVALLAAATSLLSMPPASAETPPRVRGVVTAIGGGTITLKWNEGGGPVTLNTSDKTAYAYVVPAELDDIKVRDFVGTAVKGPKTAMVAVELAIVPEDMRAGRISFYGWDPLPDPTTSMVNGLVSQSLPAAGALTPTNMTNGTVTAESGSAGSGGAAGRVLTVAYDGGKESFQITVPREAPVVRYILADKSALAIGSAVMVKVNPGDQADLVTIGKSVTPPM